VPRRYPDNILERAKIVDRFSSLRIFVRVIERGSFSHVGREMGIGQRQ